MEKKIGYEKISARKLGFNTNPRSKDETEYYDTKKQIQEINSILSELKDYE